MKKIPRISAAEWQIMKVVWNRAPVSANEIVEFLADSSDWKDKTIKTLINRLVKKDVLGFEKNGRSYLYYPIFSERQCVEAESDSFLHRVFDGSLHPMFAHFVQQQRLTTEDIRKLKKIIDEAEAK